MEITSTRFGAMTVNEESLITFPQGLPGFENARRFFIMDHPGDRKLKWLHSADDPGLALVVVDPFEFFTGYQPEISDECAAELGVTGPNDAAVLSVVSIRSNPVSVSANLLAPIVISSSTRRGRQVILQGTNYTTRHEIVRAEVQETDAKPSAV